MSPTTLVPARKTSRGSIARNDPKDSSAKSVTHALETQLTTSSAELRESETMASMELEDVHALIQNTTLISSVAVQANIQAITKMKS